MLQNVSTFFKKFGSCTTTGDYYYNQCWVTIDVLAVDTFENEGYLLIIFLNGFELYKLMLYKYS